MLILTSMSLCTCSTCWIKEPKKQESANAWCVLLTPANLDCELAKSTASKRSIPLVFYKNFSPSSKGKHGIRWELRVCRFLFTAINCQSLTNNGKMVFQMPLLCAWGTGQQIHPDTKPVMLIQQLISLFTDPCEVVIDPCGSRSTIIAAKRSGRSGMGLRDQKIKPIKQLTIGLAKKVRRVHFWIF